MFSKSSLRFFSSSTRSHAASSTSVQQILLRKSSRICSKVMMNNRPLYYSSSSSSSTSSTIDVTPSLPTQSATTTTTTENTTKTKSASSSPAKYTSTEIRLIKKQKERVFKKEKVDEVVGKLFNIKKAETSESSEPTLSSESTTIPGVTEKKKRRSKKAEVKESTTIEEPIKKEAFTNPQIDSLVENILTMTVAGQSNLAASAEEEDELISLLKTKRRQRFNTENSNVGVNVGPTTYKSSIDKFTQQEVDFKQYTKTRESELSSQLEMSDESEEGFKPPIVDPEDEDILSYLRELKDRTLKQQEEENKSSILEDDNELDEEEKIVEKAWKDIASKPESVAKSVEAELDEPVRQDSSKSSVNTPSNKKGDDVVMQFLQDLLK